jgi:hypothetical protein
LHHLQGKSFEIIREMERGALWNVKTINAWIGYIAHRQISVAYLQSCLDTGTLLAGPEFFVSKV